MGCHSETPLLEDLHPRNKKLKFISCKYCERWRGTMKCKHRFLHNLPSSGRLSSFGRCQGHVPAIDVIYLVYQHFLCFAVGSPTLPVCGLPFWPIVCILGVHQVSGPSISPAWLSWHPHYGIIGQTPLEAPIGAGSARQRNFDCSDILTVWMDLDLVLDSAQARVFFAQTSDALISDSK